MINLSSIQAITDQSIQLLSVTEKLRREEQTKEAFKYASKLRSSLRKLFIATMLSNKTIVCISGLQGAGKTTLMKNFYGIGDEYMNVSLGRGERIPVLITEGKVSKPCMKAIAIEKDENDNYSRCERVVKKEEIISVTSGENDSIMYLELTVPYKHTNNSGVSFMLLPGFEKKNEYWNDLIEFSVNSSDAAVFVFNEASFSNADNYDYLRRIETRFGKNVVYAISGSDGSNDNNESVKKTCVETLKINQYETDKVVCVGQYNDEKKNEAWINAFKVAIEKYALNEVHSAESTDQYITHVLLDFKDTLYDVLDIINEGDDSEIKDLRNHQMLKAFDVVIKAKRKELENNIESQFEIAKGHSSEFVVKELDAKPWIKRVKNIFHRNLTEQYLESQELVKKSLWEGNVCLPDMYLGLALRNSIRTLDNPIENNPNAFQMLIDTKRDENKNVILYESDETKSAFNDVCALIKVPNKNGERLQLQCKNVNGMIRAVAEVSTYYYGLTSYNELLVEKTSALANYVPAESHLKGKDVIAGAEESKKFAIGLAGVMGVDILADGSLNLISQIAASCSIALPWAAAGAAVIVGTGAALAVLKDINNMQRADCESARMVVFSIYDNIQRQALERFDIFTQKVRERIEDNLIELEGSKKQLVNIYNAKVVVNNMIDLLDEVSDEYLKKTNNVESYY